MKSVVVTRQPDRDLRRVIAGMPADFWQSDCNDFLADLAGATPCLLPVLREGDRFESVPENFVYEGRQSGRGQVVDWTVAAQLATKGRMILAGGLNPANVAEAIRIVRPWGVDVSSGVEASPGIKDPELIRQFVAAAREAAAKSDSVRGATT